MMKGMDEVGGTFRVMSATEMVDDMNDVLMELPIADGLGGKVLWMAIDGKEESEWKVFKGEDGHLYRTEYTADEYDNDHGFSA